MTEQINGHESYLQMYAWGLGKDGNRDERLTEWGDLGRT
jgi:hypothetical protein